MPFGSACCSSPGRPPQARSGASDQTPISANSSTIASSRVSIARNASSTAVIGLPTSVTAMLATTSGASVGAGSGKREHADRERAGDGGGQACGEPARRGAGTFGARRGFGAAQPRGGTDQQARR